jgi:ABC-type transport system substrate-binding protein
MKRLSLAVVILILATVFGISCSSQTSTTPTSPTSTSTPEKQYGGTFRYIEERMPTSTIGWLAEPKVPLGLYACAMMEPFIEVASDGSFIPMLATGWEIASDLKSVTFILRKNVKFHDGSDFNAHVAKWNIDQFIDAKMTNIKDFESVTVIDDYTIRINLKKYTNTLFCDVIAQLDMVSQAAFDREGKEGLRWNPVGTGPFKFESYERDVAIKMSKFEDYWQEGKPYLDAIEAHFILDPLTASASFEAGEVDAIGSMVPKILYDLQQKDYEILTRYLGALTLIPDSKNPDSVLANPKVRKAIDYAIDRDAIVSARGFGFLEPTYQFAPPGASAYIQDLDARIYNTEKAKQLLVEAEYPEGFDMTIYGESTEDKETGAAIQACLAKVGINAKLEWLDHSGFVTLVMGGWNDGMLFVTNGFTPANINAGNDFVWSQKVPFFPSVLKTDDLQALMDESMRAKDYDPDLAQKVLRYIHDEAMFLSIYCTVRGHAVKPYVHDTGFNTKLETFMSFLPADIWLSK